MNRGEEITFSCHPMCQYLVQRTDYYLEQKQVKRLLYCIYQVFFHIRINALSFLQTQSMQATTKADMTNRVISHSYRNAGETQTNSAYLFAFVRLCT